jgi:hypothetical protein
MILRHFIFGSSSTTTPIVCAFLLGGGLTHHSSAQTPPQPIPPPIQAKADPDAALVISLLGENLSNRTFSFTTVAEACSGKRVLPLTEDAAHKRVTAALEKALKGTLAELSSNDSPVRKLQQIDEASKLLEEVIIKRLNETPGIKCSSAPTRNGEQQRPGYPTLRIVDEESKIVFYLDPKLIEQGSADKQLSTFHFEPKNEMLKITEDAVHLVVSIEHAGKEGAWTFTGWRLVDLSKLKVHLKAEFQATNAELYQKTELSLPDSSR